MTVQTPEPLRVSRHRDQVIISQVCHFGPEDDPKHEVMAQNLVAAYNATYAKGINPETVHDMRDALTTAATALEHSDCWATGPLTGDPIEDLVVCPGCRALEKISTALAKAKLS